MPQKFTITLTLEEDVNDPTAPDLHVSTKADDVITGRFAMMAKTFKELTMASLEVHLQVSSDLAETAQRASDAGAFDEE